MADAQQWLDKNYPDEIARQRVEKLIIGPYIVPNQGENVFRLELENSLILSDFIKLKILHLCSNKITKLNVVNCLKIESINCSENSLTNLNFLSTLNSKKITNLYLKNNNVSERNLSCFSKFVNLTTLLIGNSDKSKIQKGIYNRFTGSLEFLKDLTKLERLDIKNTDID